MSIQCHTTVKVRIIGNNGRKKKRLNLYIGPNQTKLKRNLWPYAPETSATASGRFQVPFPGALRRCSSVHRVKQEHSVKEEDSSRVGRMRGEAVPAKKINWADKRPITPFRWSTDIRASQDFVSYTAGIRERLQVTDIAVSSFFLSR
ncbi:unnamed protein product [Heterotrigona itama]|uniref:Uncharacterized protein n=1 Tax=Heterotrigona itama TaxID=395501 RepID=A0A6V7HBD5_9HYME|nr:unnamed protein product [Heterotrigona itama]